MGLGLSASPFTWEEPRMPRPTQRSPGAWASRTAERVAAGGVWRVGHPVITAVISWDGGASGQVWAQHTDDIRALELCSQALSVLVGLIFTSQCRRSRSALFSWGLGRKQVAPTS